MTGAPAARPARPPRGPLLPPGFPRFSILWLTGTSLLHLALADRAGALPAGFADAVGFTPARVAAEPWRAPLALAALPFAGDAIQFAYLVALFSLFVPAHEAREGPRPTLVVFFGGGIVAVLLGTLLVFVPLALARPDDPLVAYAMTRPYLGWSAATFAVAGALAGSLATRRARLALLLGLLVWELGVWLLYFRARELLTAFHFAAVGIGFWAGRTGLGSGRRPASATGASDGGGGRR